MADLKLMFWNQSGSGYASRLRPEEWENVRGSITEWVQADLQNKEVLALLLEEYGLKISEGQLKGKVKEWRLQGRRARKAAAQWSADVSVSQVIQEAAVSHRVANPALHAFTQTTLSDTGLEVFPTLNAIFNRGPERMGFDAPHGRLCMSRAPSHNLERYRNQVWPLEAMASRLRRMQHAIQQPNMGVREIMSTIELCLELWLISIFVEEDDKATGFHRSAYTTLLSVLCFKVGIFARPTSKVFEAPAMVINYWALGWPRRSGWRDPRARERQPGASPWAERFIGPLERVIAGYMKETVGWAILELSR